MKEINKNNNNNDENYWTKLVHFENGKCKKYRFRHGLQSQNADYLVGIKKV